MKRLPFCPVCEERDNIKIEGTRMTMKEKAIDYTARKVWESTVFVDPIPMPTSVSLLSLFFQRKYCCPRCGWKWTDGKSTKSFL